MTWDPRLSTKEVQAILAKWYNPWSKTWVSNSELRDALIALANASMYCTIEHKDCGEHDADVRSEIT